MNAVEELDALHGCGYRPISTPAVNIIDKGFHAFVETMGAVGTEELYAKVLASREFGPGLFLTEEEFDTNPQYKGVNPRPGRNLLETLYQGIALHSSVTNALTELLGPVPTVLDSKIVCGVPKKWVPAWLLARIEGNPVNNLGPYVRPEYRDITYFMGIDWHQDIIDWPDRVADFVTVYVYLHDVGENDCPLHVMPYSHLRGAEQFPHKDAGGGLKLVGYAGDVFMWHPFTLHGTGPCRSDNPRLSLRMLVVGNSARLNSKVQGPLALVKPRRDLASDGSARIKGNILAHENPASVALS